MNSKPKLLFVYDMLKDKEAIWLDGLWAALNLLENDFELTRFNMEAKYSANEFITLPLVPDNYDFILGWGAFNSPVASYLGRVTTKTPLGLCIGGVFPPLYADKFAVLFYETQWYGEQVKFHPRAIKAFGVNTDIYCEVDAPFPIIWDYLGVGAFADWKRWQKMKTKAGRKLVIGEFQKGNRQESSRIVVDLVSNGVMASDMVNPFDLAMIYHCSRTLYIPADTNGGGERAIWEAKACGLSVEIEADNPKLQELVLAPVKSHVEYAEKLKKGILSCL